MDKCIDNSVIWPNCNIAKPNDIIRFVLDKKDLDNKSPKCLDLVWIKDIECLGKVPIFDKIVARNIGSAKNWTCECFSTIKMVVNSLKVGTAFTMLVDGEAFGAYIVREGANTLIDLQRWILDDTDAVFCSIKGNVLDIKLKRIKGNCDAPVSIVRYGDYKQTNVKLKCNKTQCCNGCTVKVVASVPCDFEDGCYRLALIDKNKPIIDEIAGDSIVWQSGIYRIDNDFDYLTSVVSFKSRNGDYGREWLDEAFYWQGRLPLMVNEMSMEVEESINENANGEKVRGYTKIRKTFVAATIDLLPMPTIEWLLYSLKSDRVWLNGVEVVQIGTPTYGVELNHDKQVQFNFEAKTAMIKNDLACDVNCGASELSYINMQEHTFDFDLWLTDDDGNRERYDIGVEYLTSGKYKVCNTGDEVDIVFIDECGNCIKNPTCVTLCEGKGFVLMVEQKKC